MIQSGSLKRVWIVAASVLAAFLLVAAQGKHEKGTGSEVWAHITAASTDSEYSYDTTPTIEIKGWNSLQIKFTLKVDTNATTGYGLKDTGRIWLQTQRNGVWVSIDSTNKAAGAPTTWTFNKRYADDVCDTLLGEYLRFAVLKIDTFQASIVTLHDSGTWEWYLK